MWYRQDRWRNRLLAEQELMRSRFPNFSLLQTAGGELRWIGVLEPVPDREFVVSVRYPSTYPYAPPRFFVEEPPLRPGAPHVYSDNSLCVYKQQWNPMTGTAASCVPLVAAWLVGYLNWTENGQVF